MMNDLISRRDAIDNMAMVIWGYPNEIYPQLNDYSMALGLAKDGLMGVPSAQQWIPCSERMPECDYTDVLICVHDKRKGCEKDYYIISAYTSGKHWEPTLAVDMTDFDVVAWMPLPEPYKGEQT